VTNCIGEHRTALGQVHFTCQDSWWIFDKDVKRRPLTRSVDPQIELIWPTISSRLFAQRSPVPPGVCHFPIAYQQEYFNQLTSGEGRTRFVRGRALLVQALGQKKRGARPPRLRAGRSALAPGSLGGAAARRPDRTTATDAITRRGR